MSKLFYPGLLENYDRLERHLTSQDLLKGIKTLKKSPSFQPGPHGNEQKIVAAVVNPFLALAALFLQIASYIVFPFSTRLGQIVVVLSRHMHRPWEQVCAHWNFSKLIVPTFPCPQLGTSDTYTTETILVASLQNQAIQELTLPNVSWKARAGKALKQLDPHLSNQSIEKWLNKYQKNPMDALSEYKHLPAFPTFYQSLKKIEHSINKKEAKIDLFPTHGASKGAALFFLYLYLHSNPSQDGTIRKHLAAVAEKFRTGFPRQALLLQNLGKPEVFLHLEKTTNPEKQVSLYQLDCVPDAIKSTLDSLEPGDYQIDLLHRSFALVKGEQVSYLFDSHTGLIEMTTEEMQTHILKQAHQKGHPNAVLEICTYRKD